MAFVSTHFTTHEGSLPWERVIDADAKALRERHAENYAKKNGPLLDGEIGDKFRDGIVFCPRSFTRDVCRNGGGSRIWLHGPSLLGKSVSVRVSGFFPHFFVAWPGGPNDKEGAAAFINALNNACVVGLLEPGQGRRLGATEAAVAGQRTSPIVSWSFTQGTPVKSAGWGAGYNGPRSENTAFLRVNFYAPDLLHVAHTILQVAPRFAEKGTLHEVAVAAVGEMRARNAEREKGQAAGQGSASGANVDIVHGQVVRKSHTALKLEAAAKSCISPFGRPGAGQEGQGEGQAQTQAQKRKRESQESARSFAMQHWRGLLPPEGDPFSGRKGGDWKERFVAEESSANALCDAALSRVTPFCKSLSPQALLDATGETFTHKAVYDAELDFELRFATELGFCPEQWVHLRLTPHASPAPGDCPVRAVALGETARETFADYEFHCSDASRLAFVPSLNDTPPPQLCVSADGEMEPTLDGGFPDPVHDRVLQLSAVAFDPVLDPHCQNADQCVTSRCFMLGTIPSPGQRHALSESKGTACFTFDDEFHMLRAFSRWMRALQPDMLTGYNVEHFDTWYVVERTRKLGQERQSALHERAVVWSRFRDNRPVRLVEKRFETVAAGVHEFREAKCHEFWVFDLLQNFKRNIKLRNYSLDSVAQEFLGDKKEDVAYSRIREMQGTPLGRAELARYCIKDSLLPARIIGKRQLLLEMIELCRYTGVTIDMLNRRGQQIRGKACLHREARWQAGSRTFFYTRTRAEREAAAASAGSYEGAVVLPPHRGFHAHPVAVLDFASLYPSIIVTNNMCPTTLLPFSGAEREQRLRRLGLRWGKDTWSPNKTLQPGQDGVCFVRTHVREGIVPRILRKLLGLRSEIKARLKRAKNKHEGDPEYASLLAVLDKQQLAVKLICNSMYGLFGTTTSFVECIPLASGVTEEGRRVIGRTKAFVEEEFARDRSLPFRLRVVYGDTDSVFVKFVPLAEPAGSGKVTVQDAAKWGLQMAEEATTMLRREGGDRAGDRMQLEFEKVFSLLLMLQKKRYAGLKWVLSKDGVTLLAPTDVSSSGMETARRDPCRFVSQGISELLVHLLNVQNKDLTVDECLEEGKRYVHERMLRPILQGTVDFWSVMQSNQLRKTVAAYKKTGIAAPVHVALAEKLRKRHGDGSPQVPKPGDRVQYVVVENLEEGNKKSSCGEDPLFAWKNKMRLNLQYYTDSVLCKPLVRVFGPLLVPDGALGMAPTEEAREKIVEKRVSQYLFHSFTGTKRLAAERQPDEGAPGKKATFNTGKGMFLRVVARCALCNGILEGAASGGGAQGERVCGRCAAERAGDIEKKRKREKETFEELKRDRKEVWGVCQTCIAGCKDATVPPQPSDIEDLSASIACENVSCKTLWRRLRNDRLFGDAIARGKKPHNKK